MSSLDQDSIAKTPAIDWHLAADVLLRAVTAVAFSAFAIGAISHWIAAPTRITLLLLVVANCFTTGLTLIARTPVRRDWRPLALLCSLGGTYGCLAYNLNTGVQVVPETIGALLQIGGIGWQLFAKVSLKRAFGILPANRGVVSHGAYRFVRHPMYLGYFVTDLGFLLTNFSPFNLTVHVVQLAFQIGRILQEEKMLETDAAYRCYRNAVRYRFIPLVF
ncbi:MAG: isoprenylcysteine carboxylmethyltransferase family protein [Paraburkholderia sp.]|nr:MAG: isoprenylcysteine carboxylmethyltransferase family protein [Paraburkholderia sp.]